MDILEFFEPHRDRETLLNRAQKISFFPLTKQQETSFPKSILYSSSITSNFIEDSILKSFKEPESKDELINAGLSFMSKLKLIEDKTLWSSDSVERALRPIETTIFFISTKMSKQTKPTQEELSKLQIEETKVKRLCHCSLLTIQAIVKCLERYRCSADDIIPFEVRAQSVMPEEKDLWHVPMGREALETLGNAALPSSSRYQYLITQLSVSCEVNEHNHRFLYKKLHFDVIDMIKAISYSLTLSTKNDEAITDECLIMLINSALKFVKTLKTVMYIESHMELTPDEVVYGRILPYLWAECNDKSVRYRFACGYNIGGEIRLQGFELIYQTVHKMLMYVSSLYTIICLDYMTVIDPSSDIEEAILKFRDKLENLLQQAYVYFVAMVNREEILYSLPDRSEKFNASETHLAALKSFTNVTSDMQSVLVLAHSMKLLYDVSLCIVNYEVLGPENYLGSKARIYSLNIDQKITVDPYFNEFSTLLSYLHSLGARIVPRTMVEDYVYLPTVMELANEFVELGTHLEDFLMFSKVKVFSKHRDQAKYVFATLKLKNGKKYKKQEKNLRKLIIPPQVFSVDTYALKSSGWVLQKEEEQNLEFEYCPFWKWRYCPNWIADLIQAIVTNGFAGARTVVELQVLDEEQKYFWETNDKVRDRVLEQFALGVIVKDNAVRHRTWRHTNLAKALQARRFLECKIDQFFKNKTPPPVSEQYIQSISNLSYRLFWNKCSRISDHVLRILFPIDWWDKMLCDCDAKRAQTDPNFIDTLQYQLGFNLPPKVRHKPHLLWIRANLPMIRTKRKELIPLGKH